MAARLRGAGLTCNVLNEDDFRASMFEKHMWISAFMLLGVHHGGTVGEVASKHADDLRKMVEEMMAVLREERGVAFKAGVPERLLAYAHTVAHFPTALKEFEWRNQFWLDLTRARESAGIQHAPCAWANALLTSLLHPLPPCPPAPLHHPWRSDCWRMQLRLRARLGQRERKEERRQATSGPNLPCWAGI